MNQIQPTFEFVTITSPNQIRDPTKQKVIRKQARRRDNDVKSRSRKSFKITFDLPSDHVEEYHPSSITRYQGTGLCPTIVEEIRRSTLSISFPSIETIELPSLWPEIALELNGFSGMDKRAVQLINFVRYGGDGHFCPLQESWFRIGQLDSTAFCVTLANASRLINKTHHSDSNESREAMFIYTRSIYCLRRRLQMPEEGVSDGIIASILEFAYYDFLIQDLDRWLVHMSGLANIVCRRGGLQTLHSAEMILLLTFWIDVSGSFIFDNAPFFPPPDHITTRIASQTSPSDILRKWNGTFPMLSDITTLLCDAADLAIYIDKSAIDQQIWKNDIFVAKTFNVVAHELLSLERYTEDISMSRAHPQLLIRESIRQACLILFALLRDRFSVHPSGLSQHKSGMKEFLAEKSIDWSNFQELRLWVLLTASLANEKDEMAWYSSEINAAMIQIGVSTWEHAMEIARSVLWVEVLHARSNQVREFLGM